MIYTMRFDMKRLNELVSFLEPPRTSPQQDAAVTGGPLPPPPPSSQQPQPYIQVSYFFFFFSKPCAISFQNLLSSIESTVPFQH